MNVVEQAKIFATIKHLGQKRRNGEDYIVHPTSVSLLLERYKKSHNIDRLVAAAYLHDTLEDTETTYYELVNEFGYDIASLVMELTTNEDMKNMMGKDRYLSYKLAHMTSWALVIKLCDRLDNVMDLNLQSEEFRIKYSNETLFIIDYISNNRYLSGTHRTIIDEIMRIVKGFINLKSICLL